MQKHQGFYQYKVKKRRIGSSKITLVRILKNRLFWRSLLLFILLIELGYLFFLSNVFHIKDIKIGGNQKIKNEELLPTIEISLKSRFDFLDNNLFLVNASEMKQSILSNFPRIEDTSIIKQLPDELKISIKERTIAGIWCKQSQKSKVKSQKSTNGEPINEVESVLNDTEDEEEIIEECYYIDKNGVVFEEAPLSSGSLLFVMKSNLNPDIKLGDKAISAETMIFLLQTKNAFSDLANLGIKEFIIKSLFEIEAVMSENWSVYLNILSDPQKNAMILKKLLEETIKEKRVNLEYIDLRVPNRVYYK